MRGEPGRRATPANERAAVRSQCGGIRGLGAGDAAPSVHRSAELDSNQGPLFSRRPKAKIVCRQGRRVLSGLLLCDRCCLFAMAYQPHPPREHRHHDDEDESDQKQLYCHDRSMFL